MCQNADYMTAQVFDLTDKLEQSEAHLGRSGFVMGVDAAEASEDRLTKATKDRYVVLIIAATPNTNLVRNTDDDVCCRYCFSVLMLLV